MELTGLSLWELLRRLVDEGGPLDVLRNDGVIGEGGVAGVEGRWLEQASEDEREGYRRAKGEPKHNGRSNVVILS